MILLGVDRFMIENKLYFIFDKKIKKGIEELYFLEELICHFKDP